MTCEVIRDLLPLYVDDVASQESRELVEDHIRQCDACRALYENMCTPLEVQATEKELDYMAAVKRQNKRFLLRLYGSLLAVVLLLAAGTFVSRMLRYESWQYAPETIDRETILKEMPEALLTTEEKALAKEIFSLPQVQQAFAEAAQTEPTCALAEDLCAELLQRIGKSPDELSHVYSGIFGKTLYLQYQEADCSFILEFIDSDQSGHADLLRKTVSHAEKNVRDIYSAEINAAVIGETNTGDAEKDALAEEFSTIYERTSGQRKWLDFLKQK